MFQNGSRRGIYARLGIGGQASDDEQVTATQGGNGSGSILPSVLSVVALLLSIVAVLFAWRWRRPTPEAEVTDSPSRQDVNA